MVAVASHAEYAAALDLADWHRWTRLFLPDGLYRLLPRENDERGLALATQAFESQGMLRDRLHGIRETLFRDPNHQRHVHHLPGLSLSMSHSNWIDIADEADLRPDGLGGHRLMRCARPATPLGNPDWRAGLPHCNIGPCRC